MHNIKYTNGWILLNANKNFAIILHPMWGFGNLIESLIGNGSYVS